ncbi:MAG TPA: biopolymer transporter ExbD [Pirellulaceae bacterium]|nr:biopolymer transporter ExbD [Pirellulaceae bacterium]
MKTPRYRPRRHYGMNMTPMIDVVFLLIIFFLVSSHLARQEARMELSLPVAKSGSDDTDFETPRLTINVQQDGSWWLSGRTLEPAKLLDALRQFRQQHGEQIEVRIRGSRLTEYRHVEPIMLACTRAGIWNVSYAVFREELQ